MDEFNKQKIAWNRISSIKQFALINSGMYIQDSMHFIIGENLNYLCSILNSKLIQWLLFILIGEASGGNAGNADNIWNLHIPRSSVDEPLSNNEIYLLYKLTDKEIEYIEGVIENLQLC